MRLPLLKLRINIYYSWLQLIACIEDRPAGTKRSLTGTFLNCPCWFCFLQGLQSNVSGVVRWLESVEGTEKLTKLCKSLVVVVGEETLNSSTALPEDSRVTVWKLLKLCLVTSRSGQFSSKLIIKYHFLLLNSSFVRRKQNMEGSISSEIRCIFKGSAVVGYQPKNRRCDSCKLIWICHIRLPLLSFFFLTVEETVDGKYSNHTQGHPNILFRFRPPFYLKLVF